MAALTSASNFACEAIQTSASSSSTGKFFVAPAPDGESQAVQGNVYIAVAVPTGVPTSVHPAVLAASAATQQDLAIPSVYYIEAQCETPAYNVTTTARICWSNTVVGSAVSGGDSTNIGTVTGTAPVQNLQYTAIYSGVEAAAPNWPTLFLYQNSGVTLNYNILFIRLGSVIAPP